MADSEVVIQVENLTAGYGDVAIIKDINFEVQAGEVLIILGGSGCGKSTLLKHMIGLLPPVSGKVLIEGNDIVSAQGQDRVNILRRIGVMYQNGALFGSMNLVENICLVLEEFTDLPKDAMEFIARMRLKVVSLHGSEYKMPSEISGGMRKRAGLARAMALDPDILFFDEPSAGLDPISSRLLDDLILELRDSLGTTVVVVTHELASIFAIGNDSVFLDPETKTMLASGNPETLLAESKDPKVLNFLTRGKAGDGETHE